MISNYLFYISLFVYVCVSSKVGVWSLVRREPAYHKHCPVFFVKHPIPFYVFSWITFWSSAVVGVYSSVNSFAVSACLIAAYFLSGIFVKVWIIRIAKLEGHF